MAHLPVQCQNCGARYKIPETFRSDKAKCKACGTMIDVAAARDAGADDTAKKPVATHASGGTRKPRQAGAASSRRHKSDVHEPVKVTHAPHSSRRHGRGAHDAADEGEEGGRHHYEKKKDNTPLIAGIVIVALAAVAGIFWMVFDPFAEQTTEVAGKPNAESAKGDADKDKSGDAGKTDEGKADVSAADASATKDAEAKAAAAKKKAAAKKLRPKTKRAQAIKADEDVKDPEDVFKPASALKALPRPEGLSDENLEVVNDALEALTTGGGMDFIRAPKKLLDVGVEMIPIATNKLITMDFTTNEANAYAYQLGKIIGGITDFGLGWEPVLAGEEPDPKVANRNAGRVWDLHVMARLYWHSKDKFEKWQASRKK